MTAVPERQSPSGSLLIGTPASVVRASLADLVANDNSQLPNGCRAWVVDQQCEYQLDTTSALTAFSPYIVARATPSAVVNGALPAPSALPGQWFRRSRSNVIGNTTLWMTGPFGSKKVIGYTIGQQQAVGSVTLQPDIVLDISNAMVNANNTPFDVCPDTQGNLWVTAYRPTSASAQVLKLALADCLQSGAPTPRVSLVTTGSGSAAIWAIAFDKQNALYGIVSSNTAGNTKVQKFAQYDYAQSGTPTPFLNYTNVTIGSSQAPVFDGSGNLWLACFAGGTTTPGVAMFTAAQLAATVIGPGALAGPAVFWSGSNFVGPSGACFHPDGSLWIVDYATGGATSSLKRFDPTAATGNPAPSVTITSPSLFGVNNLVFDQFGNAWCANADNGKIVRIAAADLTTSGSKTAAAVITQTQLAFLANLSFPQNVQRSGLVASGAPLIL